MPFVTANPDDRLERRGSNLWAGVLALFAFGLMLLAAVVGVVLCAVHPCLGITVGGLMFLFGASIIRGWK
jgi:hypothetical protein